MRFFRLRLILLCLTAGSCAASFAQVNTNTALLKQAAVEQAAKEKTLYEQLEQLAKQKGWKMKITGKNGYVSMLVGVDDFGLPLYVSTFNNSTAAATIGTNKLWPGGSTGLNLSGSSNSVKGKLAIWDGGAVRGTHVELTGRVLQKDAPGSLSDHSTHVAGTLIATGVNPLAKGMSFAQQQLVAYDFANDASEMMGEAPNLLLSNHSYGLNAGWNFNADVNPPRWEFLGQFDANEDYKFGYYSSTTQTWDSIAYNAPYYLIVKAAGNNRDMNGPAVGQPYWRYNSSGQMTSAGNRPAGISNNDSYDIMSTTSTAKNVLTVGAIEPLPSGYTAAKDVRMSTFSSWGPTDDGRIKPDVVADGVDLLSSIATSDNAYDIYGGTSMSTPNAAGSLLLLQEYYAQLHAGSFMRAATLKGLIIHTADEAGTNPGPDYQFGWGLINMPKAASVITSNNTQQLIQENILNNGGTFTLPVIASGSGTLSATISWTDPKASVIPVSSALNNPSKRLVDDLDIVVKKGATTYMPWILNPAAPASAATKGDNITDNVEKVEIPEAIPGEAYTIQVTHKGTLERGTQAYSLIVSGVGGQAYCASAPLSTAGARIDSVSFANIRNKNTPGCTSYGSFTGLTGNFEPGQQISFFARLNSCDATNVDKILKVFIDANNDGDFTDPGENLATSGVINGNGDYSATLTVPANLTTGKYTILRIVMQETNSVAAVTPCGSYNRGETQDYRIAIVSPSLDFGITELVAPRSNYCGFAQQYVSVRVRNFGTADKINIPLTAVVKQGATTVATLTATYSDTIYANTDEVYTFQTPVNLAPNTTYTITSTAGLTGDQNTGNDQNITSITTRPAAANPAGTAVVCSSNVQLNVTNPSASNIYNWYTSAAAATPVASGASASTTTVSPSYFLSSNELPAKFGPANKQVFTDGGYNAFYNNIVKITASQPTTLETAKLYIGNSGQITFLLREIVSENPDGSYTYYPISSTTIDVYATAPTPPVLGAQNNNPADLGATYYLGIDFPEAANYYLVIQCANGASIFRNNNITTNPYPQTIPGVISFTGNSAIDASDPNFYQKFWYFYYDMQVRIGACASGRTTIVPTTLPAPTITIAGNVLTSSAATGNQWLINGAILVGETGQTLTATQSGIYSVQVSSSGCTLTSNQINFVATAVPNVDPAQIGLTVSPNPAPRGQFNLQLKTITRSDLDISLVNTAGQVVYHSNTPGFIGQLSQPINPGRIAAGIYYLKVQHDKKMYIKKIVVAE